MNSWSLETEQGLLVLNNVALQFHDSVKRGRRWRGQRGEQALNGDLLISKFGHNKDRAHGHRAPSQHKRRSEEALN